MEETNNQPITEQPATEAPAVQAQEQQPVQTEEPIDCPECLKPYLNQEGDKLDVDRLSHDLTSAQEQLSYLQQYKPAAHFSDGEKGVRKQLIETCQSLGKNKGFESFNEQYVSDMEQVLAARGFNQQVIDAAAQRKIHQLDALNKSPQLRDNLSHAMQFVQNETNGFTKEEGEGLLEALMDPDTHIGISKLLDGVRKSAYEEGRNAQRLETAKQGQKFPESAMPREEININNYRQFPREEQEKFLKIWNFKQTISGNPLL